MGLGCRRDEGIPPGRTPGAASLWLQGPPPAGISGFEATVMCLSAAEGDLQLEGAGSWHSDIV